MKTRMEAFAAARFATHPDGRIAARVDPAINRAWCASRLDDCAPERFTDERMAADGWSPLDESYPVVVASDMVDKAHRSLIGHHGYGRILRSEVEEALTAALSAAPATNEADSGFVEAAADDWHSAAVQASSEALAAASRARRAESALEDLREQYGTAVREKDEWEANAEAAEERLQVTDAMVARARESLRSDGWAVGEGSTSLRDALTAALTETPARPDGAEALVPTLRRLGETSKRWLGEFSDDDLDEFADALASEGVRAPGEVIVEVTPSTEAFADALRRATNVLTAEDGEER